MIACRSFIRADRTCKLANAFLSSNKPVVVSSQLQGCKDYHSLSYFNNNTMDRQKKQKTSKPVWRPISTHSTSHQQAVKVETGPSIVSGDVKLDTVPMQTEIGKHSVTVEVAPSLIRIIKGKGDSTHQQIEKETGAKIIFPSTKKGKSIVIEGVSVESVTKASEKIKVILEEAVNGPALDYSHFVSLPLAINPELVEKLINFQKSILGKSEPGKEDCDVAVKLKVQDQNEHVKVEINKVPLVSYLSKVSKSSSPSDLGIDESIFIKPKTFHLTVLMLKLWNEDRIAAATEVMQRVSSKVIDSLESRPVFVRLKGLDCMKGSLEKARVLYTPVEVIGGEDRLLRACQVITDAYVEAGLVLEKDARQKLKLHGTVMNARHRKSKRGTKWFDSFDARGIIEQYGSEEWGEYLIPEVHLSKRFVYDENEYYCCCAKIPLPENKQG